MAWNDVECGKKNQYICKKPGMYYRVSYERKTYEEAVEFCKQKGGEITNNDQFNRLFSFWLPKSTNICSTTDQNPTDCSSLQNFICKIPTPCPYPHTLVPMLSPENTSYTGLITISVLMILLGVGFIVIPTVYLCRRENHVKEQIVFQQNDTTKMMEMKESVDMEKSIEFSLNDQ